MMLTNALTPFASKRTGDPLTGRHCVHMLVTDLAAFELDREAGLFRLIETAPGVSVDEVKAKTAAKILVDRPVTAMRL